MVSHSRKSRGKSVRHVAAVAAGAFAVLLAQVAPSLDSPWREGAAFLLALATAYGINKPAPVEEDI